MARRVTIHPPELAKQLFDKHGYKKALEIAKANKKKSTKDTLGYFSCKNVVIELRKLKIRL